jgi:hypothetical protein
MRFFLFVRNLTAINVSRVNLLNIICEQPKKNSSFFYSEYSYFFFSETIRLTMSLNPSIM